MPRLEELQKRFLVDEFATGNVDHACPRLEKSEPAPVNDVVGFIVQRKVYREIVKSREYVIKPIRSDEVDDPEMLGIFWTQGHHVDGFDLHVERFG